jgi:hypothetical protein
MYDNTEPPEAPAADDRPTGSRTDLERIARLADVLLERVSSARQRIEELRAELEDSEPTEVPTAPALIEEEDNPELLHDRIRLDAMNMALTGSTRDETRAHLLETFGEVPIDDIDDALNVTFGEVLNAPEGLPAPTRRFRRGSRP